MVDIDSVRGWRGRAMLDRDGDRIGTIEDIYADDRTGRPEWALVDTGLFGTRSTFVPIAEAAERDGDVQVPYEKGRVKDAPGVEADQHLSEAEEQQLWRHYSLDYGAGSQPTGRAAEVGGGDREATGRDEAMTRSEEELRVGTEARERGRVRLRKYVTTEQVTQTVPVQREELRVEREPITDANRDQAMQGPELSEAEHEVVLHEQQPVARKEVVPKERVRLDTEKVKERRKVGRKLRKERIELEEEPTDSRR